MIVVALMVAIALPMVQQIITLKMNLGKYEHFLAIDATPMLYGPLLYFYASFEISRYRNYERRFLLHGLPFIVVYGLILVKEVVEPTGPIPPADIVKKLSYVSFLLNTWPPTLFTTSFLIYTLIILKILERHTVKLPDYYSYTSPVLTLSWLKIIMYSFLGTNIFIYITFLLYPFWGFLPLINPDIGKYYGLSIFIYVFSIFAVKQPVIDIDQRESNENIFTGQEVKGKKYEKSGLQEKESLDCLQKLKKYMKDHKPYLDGDLTIEDISRFLDIPRHHITQTINVNLNQNFNAWVNSFRLQEVISKISDPQYRDYSILRIALDAGFNTKSSFNRIFKEYTGLTPSEFRAQKMDPV